MVEILFLVGRVLYGGFFVMSGMKHFTQMPMMAGYAQSKGVPAPKLAVGGSGLLLVLGGLGVLLGAYVQIALLFVALFLIPVTFQMHSYWKESDPNMKMSNEVNFWKNIALLGAALVMLIIPVPWPL